jgi:hypothetical protein
MLSRQVEHSFRCFSNFLEASTKNYLIYPQALEKVLLFETRDLVELFVVRVEVQLAQNVPLHLKFQPEK